MKRITRIIQAYSMPPGQMVLDESRGETLELVGESFDDYIFKNVETGEFRRLTKYDIVGMYLI